MDINSLKRKVSSFVSKNKYVVLILCIGTVLILLPNNHTQDDNMNSNVVMEEEISLNQQLADILSRIEGAGEVYVLLTVAEGEETIYQTDESINEQENSSSTQSDTLILTTSDKTQVGLIRQKLPPKYLGAIVVCEGADSPAVQLAVVDAVSKVTGLGANQISVLKME